MWVLVTLETYFLCFLLPVEAWQQLSVKTQRPHSLKLAALNTNTMKNTSEKKTEKLVNPNVILGNLFPLLLSCMNVDAFLSFLTLEQS